MNFITPAFERFLTDKSITHRFEPRGNHRFIIVFDHNGRRFAVSFRYKAFASRKSRNAVIHKLRYALKEMAA